MTASDWNTGVIEEFRANGGTLSGDFAGAPVLLLHHRGRKSGREFVAPLMYLGTQDDPDRIYVFGSKNGAPTNPEWYYNLTTAGHTTIERGAETYPVSVEEVTGDEREAAFAEQARSYPGFAEYAEKTAGVRIIPVLALRRQ
ncbi:MAG: nitroreductase family deazaflavin-dependent oxidoreductase [Pseudonocardiales bacterium]|nr:MAG: nitroreductase family deazaflavin-dependent oxidoreductase [Pseudonocardiales bacterium]